MCTRDGRGAGTTGEEDALMIDRIQDLGSEYGPQLDDVKEQALVYAATARERLAEGQEKVREYIVNQPARALGIALGVGVVLGWLIKRR
jgi:ElaB/YqjD/DUF883 family membrane-anchored ribosome-binding protein